MAKRIGERCHVVLTDRQRGVLEHISSRSGLPRSELIRRAIDQYISKYRKEKKT